LRIKEQETRQTLQELDDAAAAADDDDDAFQLHISILDFKVDSKLSPCSECFWVIPRLLNFVRQLFGKHCLFHLHRPMEMEQTECSETSAYKIQKSGNY